MALTRLSMCDECLQVRNLCQLIADARHIVDAAQRVASRAVRHAYISICLVFAFCGRLRSYLHHNLATESGLTHGKHYVCLALQSL